MSEIKVNKISPRSGTTVSRCDSVDTFTIPSGATINNQGTATNFGATGSASWTTTVKTSGFTAVAGEGYFVDTTSGAISVNLPAGTAGAVVAFKDYAGTFDTSALTLVQNGSDKIGGSTINATLSTEGIAVTLVFVDSIQGWLITDDGQQSEANTNPFIVATGGTVTCSGNDTIHTFTGPGTFIVSKAAACAANNLVSYLVVAGGGGGGSGSGGGGGGGAGGFREVVSPSAPYTGSPLDGYPSSPNRITVTAQSYSITVGAGGAGQPSCVPDNGDGTSGAVSTFSTITSAGGGFGAGQGGGPASPPSGAGGSGGSGGGGRYSGVGGTGNTPSTSPAQGQNGGGSSCSGRRGAGGGGGAVEVGVSGGTGTQGRGGVGTPTQITASAVSYAGGGGGAGWPGGSPAMPSGLQSNGSPCGTGGSAAGNPTAGEAGTDNRGGGGGANGNPGSAPTAAAGNGGSGIVVIRYKRQ